MRIAGIDIGSRTVKAVLIEDGKLLDAHVEYNSHDPVTVSRGLLRQFSYQGLAATGYGRHLLSRYEACTVITEIRASALGARFIAPSCRTILDIGGQDTKAISLGPDGSVRKFEMNDRCAAGTGRFLEMMAGALSYTMTDFIAAAETAPNGRKIDSMCAVFAESEVISTVARGAPRNELALGIHQAIAQRSAALLQRVPLEDDLFFTGGVAQNGCLRQLIETILGRRVLTPPKPQIVTALGAALSLALPASQTLSSIH